LQNEISQDAERGPNVTTRFYGFGINNYPGSENDLRGCVNDVILARSMFMKKFGISADYVHLRLDNRATLVAMRQKLEHMVKYTGAGDTAIFWYSGHGTQVLDRDGDELKDHKDEALVPYDFERYGLLTDDWIAHYLSSVNSDARIILIMDCCYSGTISRGFWPVSVDSLKGSATENHQTIRNKTLVLPLDMQSRETSAEGITVRPEGVGDRQWVIASNAIAREKAEKARPVAGISVTNQKNAVLLTASTDRQTSADAYFGQANAGRGAYHGAFSFALCSVLASANVGLTYAELTTKTRAWLDAKNFVQDPCCEGDADVINKPFGK
jgi:hypothetical protein